MLAITMKNQGAGNAGASTTRIRFASLSPAVEINVPTPPIPAGASVELPLVDIPFGCFRPDCFFEICTDAENVVNEESETNNCETGFCLG